MEKFLQALSFLLPTGFAWPRHPDSTLMRVLRGIAGTFDELHRYIDECVRQWQPHTTVTRLAEWEEATGLPDQCFGADQDMQTRRKLLLSRLRGPELAYEDSSPAAPGSIASMCAAMGYTVSVFYNVPFRVGRNRVGDRLGALNGILYVRVTVGLEPFRVGKNRVGDRLVRTAQDLAPLECYLRRIVPARYAIDVNYAT
ncbi:MAG TPA: putative phage tail protein [Variovorax sp.]